MKRIFALVMTVLLMLSCAACGGNTPSDSNEPTTPSSPNGTEPTAPNSSGIKHTGVKISGTITGASTFSEGLAFVCVDNNDETEYCITKEGYIVFQLENKLAGNDRIYNQFKNGYALVDGGLCDTTGKITYPEDVGATKFYDIALEGGYILAEKVTADYSSTKHEFGVMNMEFQWIVQPSEALYNSVKLDLLSMSGSHKLSFYYNDTVYLVYSKQYLDLKTGNLSDTSNTKVPSEYWQPHGDGTFWDYSENIILDLRQHENIAAVTGMGFVNGKSPIKFHNQTANVQFFTLINEKGEFLFDPITPKDLNKIELFSFDGEYLLVANSANGGSDITIHCYNSSGVLQGTLNTKDLGYMSYSCTISDGVIVVYGHINYSSQCYYYNIDFTPLF